VQSSRATPPLDPANWTSLGSVRAADGDPIAFRNFSLDMTHFESDGKHYVVWAENPGPSTLRSGTSCRRAG